MKLKFSGFFMRGGFVTILGLLSSFSVTIFSQTSLDSLDFGRFASVVLLINTSVLIVRGIFLQQISPLSFSMANGEDANRVASYYGFLTIVPPIFGFLFSLLLLVSASYFGSLDLDFIDIVVFSLSAGLLCSIGCMSGILRFTGSIGKPLGLTQILPDFALALGVFAGFYFKSFIAVFSVVQLVVIFMINIIAISMVLRRLSINFSPSVALYIFLFKKATRGGISLLIGVLVRGLDSLFLVFFLPTATFGIYSYARKFAELTTLLGPLVNARIINRLSFLKENGQKNSALLLMRKMSKLYVGSVVVLLSLLTVFYYSLHPYLAFLQSLNFGLVAALVIFRLPQLAASIYPQGFIAFSCENALGKINFAVLVLSICYFSVAGLWLDYVFSALFAIFSGGISQWVLYQKALKRRLM